MPKVNAEILKWARETAGLTPDEAVKKLDLKGAHGVTAVDRLEALEVGEDTPSRTILVKMAKHYRRPLLTFYMNDRPREGDRGEDFRTLPASVYDTEAALVDAVVRDIRARQDLVRATLEAAGEAEPLRFIRSMDQKQGVAAVVASIEQTLQFDRSTFRGKTQLQSAFAYLRDIAEAAGIFVLLVDNLGSWHSTISVEAFRGFALADDIAPFVAVNANDSPGAWSFTVVHELAHLWIGATGVSGRTAERAIEKFCSDVASEFLLPHAEILSLRITAATPFPTAKELISEFATERNVSSTMVAYKLCRAGVFDVDSYQKFAAAFLYDFREHKEAEKRLNADRGGGPTYYGVRKHRVGTALIRFVDRMMHEGNISTTKAGKVLGVGAHNVHALLEHGRPNHAV